MKNVRTVSERRFSLLVALRRGHLTARQMLDMPAYRELDPANGQRYLERDIQVLRESGYRIDIDAENRYILADQNILVDGTDVEMSILRSLLGSKATSHALAFAQSAVTKLLSSGEARAGESRLAARLPRGDAALAIAPAIQRACRIAFDYRSTSSRAASRRVVEPMRLEVHLDAFYLRGYQVSSDSGSGVGMRLFKVDRIVGKVELLDEPITHEAPASFPTTFTPVDAVVRTSRELPLASRASEVRQADGGYELILTAVDRAELYEDLFFYGLDARLVGPPELVADFEARVAHLASLGGEHD